MPLLPCIVNDRVARVLGSVCESQKKPNPNQSSLKVLCLCFLDIGSQ